MPVEQVDDTKEYSHSIAESWSRGRDRELLLWLRYGEVALAQAIDGEWALMT